MKAPVVIGSVLAILAFGQAAAVTPPYTLGAREDIYAEGPGESHPKRMELALVVTEEIAGSDGLPLPIHLHISYNNPWVGTDHPLAFRGKVLMKVTVYRGAEVLWRGKRREKVGSEWPGSAEHHFCNAFEERLEPGDLVLFRFKFKRMPSLGELGRFTVVGDIGSERTANLSAEAWGWDPCASSSPVASTPAQ